MGAPDVLAQLSTLGVVLTREGDSLIARPRSALTDEARALIRSHKASLLEALAAKPNATVSATATASATPNAIPGATAAPVAHVTHLGGGRRAGFPKPPDGSSQEPSSGESPGFEGRRLRVLAMLADMQSVRYALMAVADTEADAEAVLLALAIRGALADGGTVTCELRVPRDKYDPWLLLELIDRHGGTVH